MTCDDVQLLLLEFAEGELSEEDEAAVRAHARECSSCAGRIRQTRDMLAALGAARSTDETVSGTKLLDPPSLDAAAGLRGPRGSAARDASASATSIAEFEIIDELGRGGMGVVYRARQITLNRIVALKVLSPALLQSAKAAVRFQKEARAAGRLHHTNIVPIYAQGEHDGCLYYAMELVDGAPLSAILQSDPLTLNLPGHETAPPPPSTTSSGSASQTSLRTGVGVRRTRDFKRIARLIAEVADALHHAHEQGIIHRDIKPQNLMLGRDDKLHITDFGLARLLDEPGLTLSTEMVGTPAYASPEQLAGGRELGRHTDIFSLGVTLYELLVLQRPFGGDNIDQVIHAILQRDPAPPRKRDARVPQDLETICLRALEKEPGRRFQTAADMASDLRRYAQDFPIVSRRIGPFGRAVRWVRRNPARAGLVGTAAVVVTLASLITYFGIQGTNTAYRNACELLLGGDYKEGPAARAMFEQRWFPGTDARTYHLALALSRVFAEPQQAAQIADDWLARNPHDSDFHYLAAWAERRLQHWESMRAHLAAADRQRDAGATPDAAGVFCRGQALVNIDPDEAIRSFDAAFKLRPDFAQAATMQGRAATHLMYAFGDDENYRMAESNLFSVVKFRPSDPSPPYYLALCHLWAAECARRHNDDSKVYERFGRALEAATAAIAADRADARGYNARALILERQGDSAGALAAWTASPPLAVTRNRDLYFDRYAYAMRLYFWRHEFSLAEEMRRKRYEPAGNITLDPADVIDAAWYQAMIAATDPPRAAALADGVKHASAHAEFRLLLDSGYQILGLTAPRLLDEPLDYDHERSREWSVVWLRELVRYRRGEVDFESLRATAHSEAQLVAVEAGPRMRQRRESILMSGAHFYRGIAMLSAGNRTAAKEAFSASWRLNDDENYCFRARFVLGILETDDRWPAPTAPASQPAHRYQ